MTATLQEFKCPCCGGAIRFDSTIQKMKCPYCDTAVSYTHLDVYKRQRSDSGSGGNIHREQRMREETPADLLTEEIR